MLPTVLDDDDVPIRAKINFTQETYILSTRLDRVYGGLVDDLKAPSAT